MVADDMVILRKILRAWLLVLPLAVAAAPASAQQDGTVRSNLEQIEPNQTDAQAPGDDGVILDVREEMRLMIARISKYARRLKPEFVVVVAGEPGLVTKQGETEDDRPPARAYMRSIDAVMIDGLFFGPTEVDKPANKDRQTRLMEHAETAKNAGLKVLVLDAAKTRENIRTSFRENAKRGFVSYAAPAPVDFLNRLPGYWKRPWGNNADSVVSLRGVKNFVYLTDSSAFGRQDEFAMKMHETNFDMVVVDVFHGRNPLNKRAVDTLRYKKMGSRRLALASVDIGTAASYHYYWKPDWRERNPQWIRTPLPDDPDRHFVQFWHDEWQKLIYGNTNSFIYGVIQQGYDGIVLHGLEVVNFFEGGLDAVAENR